jgi:hypothetical protein
MVSASLDGHPGEFQIEQFKGAVGTRFKLHMKGKQGERDVTVTLADQV